MYKVIFLVVFFIVGVSITYYMISGEEEKLPVINPIDVEPDMVDPSLLRLGYGHRVGEFSFENQNGKRITQEEVKGKVHVVEYFFTHCQSICPKMNVQMQRVHKAYKSNDDVKILSFTVDPENDTIQRMKWYADKHGATGNNWHFLTGSKEELYHLARTSYFVLKPAEARNLGDAAGDFIHTNNFVLIDRFGRIRGYYNGTDPKEVDQMINDIGLLLDEESE